MALDKATLKTSIEGAFKDEIPGTPTAEQLAAIGRIATKISNAVDTFVKTGSVTVALGIPVSTTGTAAAQTGATTATGTGTIA